MTDHPRQDPIYEVLAERLNAVHLRQRLGIESDHHAKVFGQGLGLFHIENWYSIHAFIRSALRMMWLHDRGQRNARDLRLERNDVVLRNLPVSFDGFTVLQLSDLHLDMAEGITDTLIHRLSGLDYDLCVLTGDFRARTYGSYEPALEAMSRVRTHLTSPVYGVLGNHDSIRMVPALESMGIHMLLNESVCLTRGEAALHLAGVDDPHYFGADNLEKASDGIPPEASSLLLAHSPEIFRHAAHAGFDLMLSGHTHGGQICLPGGVPLLCNARCPRRYCSGAWEFGDLQGYTSRGSGVSVVDVRLNCPPEITLHRLRMHAADG